MRLGDLARDSMVLEKSSFLRILLMSIKQRGEEKNKILSFRTL